LAATAFENIARRLQGETVEFLELDSSGKNIFSRLRKMLWSKLV
ncbi:MAG: septum site-determining protein MinD, partial [Dolichospermum sp.]